MKKFLCALFIMTLIPCLAVAKPGDIHYVGVLQAEIKASPDKNSELKFVIAVGRKVVEFDRKGSWVWVGVDRTGGKDGWIKKNELSKTDPDGVKY
jgi:hypothetical protein